MVLQRLIYLDTWSSVDKTLGEELEGIALLEEVCDRGRLSFQKSMSLTGSFLCLMLVDLM